MKSEKFRLQGMGGLISALAVLVSGTGVASAAEPLAPPAIYPSDSWQAKSEAVLRVLNRLDANVETLHIQAGSTVHYQNLNIGVARCLQNAPTLRTDAAAWVDIQDTRTTDGGFHGWILAAEPSLGIFENPLYDIRVTGCAGNDVPPALPPLEHPAVPQLPGKQQTENASPVPADGDSSAPGTKAPDEMTPKQTVPAQPDENKEDSLPQ